jgi:hypothetical protein
MKPNQTDIKLLVLLIFILITGCIKEEDPPASENAAAFQVVSGMYTGKLSWERTNPTTGLSFNGVDPAALLEVRTTGPDKVTFYLTTPVFLNNPTFSSLLISKIESGSGNSYSGSFVFEYGNDEMMTDSSFGYYNQTQINIGQGGTIRMFNFTRPNLTREEAVLFEGVKR